MTDAKTLNLAVARPDGDSIRLLLTIEGKSQPLAIDRFAAASLVAEIAKALAQSRSSL